MTSPTTTGWNRPADTIRSNLESAVQGIRNRNALSPEARRTLIAAAYTKARTAMDALNSANPGKQAADLAAAKRRLFGIDDLTAGASPADRATMAMSFRDAQQRAQQLTTSSEAQELLDLADQSGDELLARAVGNAAMSGLGFSAVADKYLANRPKQQAAVDALQGMQRMRPMADLWEFVLPKPTELSSLHDSQIAAAAAAAGQLVT
jgi:hypothetical protein